MDDQERKELERDKIYTCEICHDYQGTKNQLRGHEPRCRAKMQEEQNNTENIEITHTPEQAIPEPTLERRERIPFGVPKKNLPSVPENDGFQYRIVNDKWARDPDRVKRAEEGGYTKVDWHVPGPVGTNDDGSPIMGVLMRIPKDLYEADQKEKQKEVDRVDQAIRKGTIEKQPGERRYSPHGINIHSNYNENG